MDTINEIKQATQIKDNDIVCVKFSELRDMIVLSASCFIQKKTKKRISRSEIKDMDVIAKYVLIRELK